VVVAVRGQTLPALGYDPYMAVDLSQHPYPLAGMSAFRAETMGQRESRTASASVVVCRPPQLTADGIGRRLVLRCYRLLDVLAAEFLLGG
jgi:hypothetical protein